MLLLALNVVLITWDGVPRSDFHDRGALPLFWARHASEGVVADVEASDPSLVSLPGYQAIFAGALTGCADNNCGRIERQTFAERLPRGQAAVFASWSRIALAVEHVPHRVEVDAGPCIVLPFYDTRSDSTTFAHAMEHLKQYRFVYIALGESDDRAHDGDRAGYLAALRRYDAWLDELLGKTDAAVIVTTDHGRSASDWRKHGAQWPDSKEIWAWSRGIATPLRTQLDLRPAIEQALAAASAR